MLLDTLLIAISSQCDQRCSYCYVPYDRRNLQSGDIHELLIKLASLDIRRVALIGAEPTQVNLLGHARAVQQLCNEVIVQSHGVNLKPHIQDELQFCTLGFSMDGPELIHDRYRQYYHIVRANYDYAQESGYNTQVSICVTPYTIANLDLFGDWLDGLGNTRLICNLVYGTMSVDTASQRKFGRWLRTRPNLYPAVTRTQVSCKHDGNACRGTLEVDLHGNVYSCNKAFNDRGVFASWQTQSWEEIIAKRERLYAQAKVDPACANCPIQCRAACAITRTKTGKALDCEVYKGFWYD